MPAEFDLIRALAAAQAPDPRVPVGIGDDAAVLDVRGPVVVCTDLVAEGVHFTAEAPPHLVGRKALAVNLSDCAAMAAVPVAAFVGLLTDRRRGYDYAAGVMAGVRDLARESNVSLAGGDTASHAGPVSVCVTVVATAAHPIRRTGAKPGDALLVTGALGGSLAGGRHLTFSPRVAEALRLREAADLHAMLDLSDGLLADCGRLCEASGVAATLHADAVPVHPDAAGSLAAALTDGEDFELLLAVTEADAAALLAAPPAPGLTRVGAVSAGSGVRVVNRDGRELTFPESGYEHAF